MSVLLTTVTKKRKVHHPDIFQKINVHRMTIICFLKNQFCLLSISEFLFFLYGFLWNCHVVLLLVFIKPD